MTSNSREHTTGAEAPSAAPDGTTVPPDRQPLAVQPKWRRDFPIDWAQDEYVARRDFVKFVVLTSGALAVGQLWIVFKELARRRGGTPGAAAIAEIEELPVGGAKTFAYPEGSPPRILIRIAERHFVAYDQQCTHLLCPVVPAVASGRIHCPCHNGWFDLETGRVLAGPPQRPLPRVLLELRGDTVYAVGMEKSLDG